MGKSALLSFIAVLTVSPGHAQVAQGLKETSLTLQQVVARQEAYYKTIKTAQGTVVWQERALAASAAGAGVPATRVINFAFEGDRSVTLVLPQDEARNYAGPQGKINWSKLLSGAMIVGDAVAMITKPTSGTLPEVHTVPYNPAVHDNNPLIAFHPRQVGDETVPLRELAAASVKMPTKPRLWEFRQGNALLIRIDFTNAATPDELLYYIIDPSRGYLPLEIGRTSKGKFLSRSTIVIGQTPDKTWIPARRTTVRFNAGGGAVAEESWYYEYLSINEKLAPHTISLLFFKLPDGTTIYELPKAAGAAATPAATSTASAPKIGSTSTPATGAKRYY